MNREQAGAAKQQAIANGESKYDIINPETGEPSETNARLIAAAPELLAALESITKNYTIKRRLNDNHEWQLSQYQPEWVQAALDLIAKVKGEPT